MSTPTLYNPEVRRKIAKLYDDGIPVLEIGARTGASPGTVCTIAREHGCEIRHPGHGPNTTASKNRENLERAFERYATTTDKIVDICLDERISRDWLISEVDRRGLPRRNAHIDCCEVASLRSKHSRRDTGIILGASHQGVGRAMERHEMLVRLGVPSARHEEMRGMMPHQIRERMKALP